jgi:gluconolactonase
MHTSPQAEQSDPFERPIKQHVPTAEQSTVRTPTRSSARFGARVHAPAATIALLLLAVAGCGSDGGTAAPAASTPVATAARSTEAPATTATPSTEAPTTAAAAPSDPLVDVGDVELIDDGYMWTEGPQWLAEDGVLLFTDFQTNSIYEVDGDEVTPFRRRTNGAHGLAVDPEGRLVATERQTRRVTRTESDGTVTPLAERFEGRLLNDPNDLAVRSDGTIYFTDPLFAEHPAELDFHGVFRIAPDGTLTAERRGAITEQPNGIALSPDESLLYVANWEDDVVWVFDVAADGSLSEARTFAEAGPHPDGIAVDRAGNLFVTGDEGIEAYAPDGSLWGTIEVPTYPANVTFGGVDGRTLYITAENSVFQVQLANPGSY